MKQTTQNIENAICYVSSSNGKWRLVYQGNAVCSDSNDPWQALDCAFHFKLRPTQLWDGDRGQWIGSPFDWYDENDLTQVWDYFREDLHDYLLIVKRDGQ